LQFPRPNNLKTQTRLNALTDNALMLRVKAGDLDKMGLLFERYHRPLFAFLYHMTGHASSSEDLVQNVFYRMLKYRHTFTGDGEFRTWMYHLARNVLNDSVRQNRRAPYHDDVTALAEKLGGGMAADEQLEKKQEEEMLRGALAKLSPEYREVLILSRFQELKYEEIARILNTTEGAIKVRVHRAMNELKNICLKKV
jgi:RNA polymerase sigma factor (sigma-70 family)